MARDTAAQHQLLLMRGAIASLPPEQQARVQAHADHLRAYVAQGGNDEEAGFALAALALVGAEKAAEDD